MLVVKVGASSRCAGKNIHARVLAPLVHPWRLDQSHAHAMVPAFLSHLDLASIAAQVHRQLRDGVHLRSQETSMDVTNCVVRLVHYGDSKKHSLGFPSVGA